MRKNSAFDDPTPVPLLEELAVAGSESGWERLAYLYEPFLRSRLRKHGLQHSDEDDLLQDVFAVVFRKLHEFRHNGNNGAFRTWLRQIVTLTVRNFYKKQHRTPSIDLGRWADQMTDDNSTLATEWDREHDRHVTGRLLELVRAEVDPSDFEAFRRTAINECSSAEVAASLGVPVQVVYNARSRIMARLRAIGRGLMPDE